MSEPLKDDALRAKGLAVLEDQLGPVEALRFLALISRQTFDYQHWRQEHFGNRKNNTREFSPLIRRSARSIFKGLSR